MPMINPFPWSSSLWFEKDWTVFQSQNRLMVDKYLPWTVFFFSLFLQEYDKEVKGFVYCLEGSSQTVKMQTPDSSKGSRKLPPILEPIRKLNRKNVDARVCVACSWAPPHVGGPPSKHSSEQRFFHWDYVSIQFFFLRKKKSPIVIQKASQQKGKCERTCSSA